MADLNDTVLKSNHILVCVDKELPKLEPYVSDDLQFVKENFCGRVFTRRQEVDDFVASEKNTVDTVFYVCGDVKENNNSLNKYDKSITFVIKELSLNMPDTQDCDVISLGQVPINVHNVGVYFRRYFNDGVDYFDRICDEHQFQALTESNKPNASFRKGIYLSNVIENNDETRFNLLRCSTNLQGPTDNFREIDNHIIKSVNNTSRIFYNGAPLNHVLAQVYENHIIGSGDKKTERKAKIKAHSDKTKDMAQDGLIAFCTFYKGFSTKFTGYKGIKPSKKNPYDHLYNAKESVLTKLHFKLKDVVENPLLEKSFYVTLYPGSVFIIPLLTNRLYTHEIRPSALPVDKIPIRLGYVVRCSKTHAVHKDGKTYVEKNGKLIELKEISEDNIKDLKKLYLQENISDKVVNYGDLYFSMNEGDYLKPIV